MEEIDQIYFVTIYQTKKLGIAFYNSRTSIIKSLETQENKEDFSVLKLLLFKTNPWKIITNSRAEENFIQILRGKWKSKKENKENNENNENNQNNNENNPSLLLGADEEEIDETNSKIIFMKQADFDYQSAKKRILNLNLASAPKSDLKKKIYLSSLLDFSNKLMIQAIGALLLFLIRNRIDFELDDDEEDLPILDLQMITLDGILLMDQTSYKALSIFNTENHPSFQGIGHAKEGLSLFSLLNRTSSVSSKRLLKSWMMNPIIDLQILQDRLNSIDYFLSFDGMELINKLVPSIKHIKDLREMIKKMRLSQNTTKDWVAFYRTLFHFRQILQISFHHFGLNMEDSDLSSQSSQSPSFTSESFSNFEEDEEEKKSNESRRSKKRKATKKSQKAQNLKIFQKLSNFPYQKTDQIFRELTSTLDFVESKKNDRVAVRKGINEKLDRAKDIYESLGDLLTEIGSQEIATIPPQLNIQELHIVYFPQLGYLVAIPRSCFVSDQVSHPNDSEMKTSFAEKSSISSNQEENYQTYSSTILQTVSKQGETLTSVSPTKESSTIDYLQIPHFEFQFSTEENSYFKSSRTRELDRVIGDIYGEIIDLETSIVRSLESFLLLNSKILIEITDISTELDCLISLSIVSHENNFSRPQLTQEPVINIQKGRHPLQELCVPDSFIPNDTSISGDQGLIQLITGPNSSGKCLVGDTLLFSQFGILELSELKPQQAKMDQFSPIQIQIQIQSYTGQNEPLFFFQRNVSSTIKIFSKKGFQIQGTQDHKILCYSKFLFHWKKFSDIRKGDWIVLMNNSQIWGKNNRIQIKSKQNENSSFKITTDLAELFGILLSNNCQIMLDQKIVFNTKKKECLSRFSALFTKLVPENQIKMKFWKDHHLYYCEMENRTTQNFLEMNEEMRKLFANGKKERKKRKLKRRMIPSFILQSPSHLIISFLKGFFIEEINRKLLFTTENDRISIEINSLKLSNQIQLIFLNLGIILKRKYLPNKCSQIEFCSGNWRKFTNLISTLEKRNIFLVKPELFLDQVKMIKKLDKEINVYDLSMKNEDHSYIANGFVSHNSTYLKQVGLIIFLAHIGSFVPAESAKIGLVDRFFTRINSNESVSVDQSSFMLDLSQISQMLANSTSKSLVLIDEFGKGTNTNEGIALLASVINHLTRREKLCPRSIITTHFMELFEMKLLPEKGISFFCMEVIIQDSNFQMRNEKSEIEKSKIPENIVFVYRTKPGRSLTSYGTYIAKMAGFPDRLIQRSIEIAKIIHSNGEILPLNPEENFYQQEKQKSIVEKFMNFDCKNGDILKFLNEIQKKN
ncbi:intein-containing muts protein precursor [Anaeramoeba ignava]|uniref:Intein-containing muts protein n=1 Tax=Anaeramoeba ignava TaxID=1746090 RepID=A0A9Q0RA43_ANAIG|nr:intein-containing muts protein precursor [Anaeramoeba ignava]